MPVLVRQTGYVLIVGGFVYGGVELLQSDHAFPSIGSISGAVLLLFALVLSIFIIFFELFEKHYKSLIDSYQKTVDTLGRGIRQDVKASKPQTFSDGESTKKTREVGQYTIDDGSGGNTPTT